MARITSTKDLGGGLTQTVESRSRRIVIEVDDDDRINATLERARVTRINGQKVGGDEPGIAIPLSDAQIRAIPNFGEVFGTIVASGDQAEAAIEAAAAQQAVQS